MTTEIVVAVVSVIAAAVTIAWFVVDPKNPEHASGHDLATETTGTSETTSDRLYGGADRPAGPDAETMDPDALGGDHRPPA